MDGVTLRIEKNIDQCIVRVSPPCFPDGTRGTECLPAAPPAWLQRWEVPAEHEDLLTALLARLWSPRTEVGRTVAHSLSSVSSACLAAASSSPLSNEGSVFVDSTPVFGPVSSQGRVALETLARSIASAVEVIRHVVEALHAVFRTDYGAEWAVLLAEEAVYGAVGGDVMRAFEHVHAGRDASVAAAIEFAASCPALAFDLPPSVLPFPCRERSFDAELVESVFAGAIDELRCMPMSSSPHGKAHCLVRMSIQAVGAACDGKCPLGADELVPLLVFLLARARVPNMASQLAFVDMLLNDVLSGLEEGYMLNTTMLCLGNLEMVAKDARVAAIRRIWSLSDNASVRLEYVGLLEYDNVMKVFADGALSEEEVQERLDALLPGVETCPYCEMVTVDYQTHKRTCVARTNYYTSNSPKRVQLSNTSLEDELTEAMKDLPPRRSSSTRGAGPPSSVDRVRRPTFLHTA